MRLIACILFLGCAPTPASITFDDSQPDSAHDRHGVPVRRATVRDADGKSIEPQPYITWSVDNTDVVSIADETLIPVANGVARVEARIGELSGSYAFTVELDDPAPRTKAKEPETVEKTSSYDTCAVISYGKDVVTFTCDAKTFPHGLAAYLSEHPALMVAAVSPLVRVAENDIRERALVTTYLVVTRPN